MKKIKIITLLLALMIAAAGCGAGSTSSSKEINMDDLSGARIGVNLGWETDELLTRSSEAEVYRYDMTADMLMALSYDKIDAIAVDALSVKIIEKAVEGIECIEPAAGSSAYMLVFSGKNNDLLESFNGFIEEYMNSDEYAEYMERVEAFDGENCIEPDISLTGTGRVVRIAAVDDFPRSYYDPGAGVPKGYDIEIAERWANACDLQIEWHKTEFEDAYNGLRSGKYDVTTGYFSEFYRSAMTEAGLLSSTGFCDTPIYLMRKSADKVTIAGEVD